MPTRAYVSLTDTFQEKQKRTTHILDMDQILYILPRGLAIGILISAPMGPIGMLVIQRTLSKGRWPAFFTGIGAAFSDLAYCLLTGLGISFITDFIETHQFGLQILGGIVLAAFGIYLFRKTPHVRSNPPPNLRPTITSQTPSPVSC